MKNYSVLLSFLLISMTISSMENSKEEDTLLPPKVNTMKTESSPYFYIYTPSDPAFRLIELMTKENVDLESIKTLMVAGNIDGIHTTHFGEYNLSQYNFDGEYNLKKYTELIKGLNKLQDYCIKNNPQISCKKLDNFAGGFIYSNTKEHPEKIYKFLPLYMINNLMTQKDFDILSEIKSDKRSFIISHWTPDKNT